MILKIKFWKYKFFYALTNNIKALYIRVRKSYNSPIKKKCLTVIPFSPVLPYRFHPPRKLIPHLTAPSVERPKKKKNGTIVSPRPCFTRYWTNASLYNASLWRVWTGGREQEGVYFRLGQVHGPGASGAGAALSREQGTARALSKGAILYPAIHFHTASVAWV